MCSSSSITAYGSCFILFFHYLFSKRNQLYLSVWTNTFAFIILWEHVFTVKLYGMHNTICVGILPALKLYGAISLPTHTYNSFKFFAVPENFEQTFLCPSSRHRNTMLWLQNWYQQLRINIKIIFVAVCWKSNYNDGKNLQTRNILCMTTYVGIPTTLRL